MGARGAMGSEIEQLLASNEETKRLLYAIKDEVTTIKTKLEIGNFDKRINQLELKNAEQTGKIAIICIVVGIAVNFAIALLLKRL